MCNKVVYNNWTVDVHANPIFINATKETLRFPQTYKHRNNDITLIYSI